MTNLPENDDKPKGNPATPTTFKGFWALDYKRLCSVIPPGAAPGPRLAERLAKPNAKDPRGKMPGLRKMIDDGTYVWSGYDFTKTEPDADLLAHWQNTGASIGVKTGLLNGVTLVLIDADTRNPDSAKLIAELVEGYFGTLPTRIGEAPKAGYLIAIDGAFRYTCVEFGERNAKGQLTERVEILGEGKQFVAHGIHPVTRAPYHWTRPLVPLENLTRTTPEAMLAFMRELSRVLPSAAPVLQEGGGADVDQAQLKGKLEHVTAAVRATPNTSKNFPTRMALVEYGYMIKAALPDHPNEALELFEDWAERWEDGTNDPGYAEEQWLRMQPPFRAGASKLYEIADKIGDGSFTSPMAHFDNLDELPEDPFDFAERRMESQLKQTTALTPIKWMDPADWEGVEPAEREWEVEGWIPKGEVTLLYGDGGVGKTLVSHQYATCAAAGLPWLGQATRQTKVMCFFCEDSEEEIHRRQISINRALGINYADLRGKLRISCRRYMDNLLAIWDRNAGEMKRMAVWEQVRADAIAFGASVLIIDTLADVYAGNEIDRAQVTAFVKSCLGKLAAEIGGSVIVLGHPSQSGKSSGSGTSGSTAWSNAVRSRLYLRYPDKQTTGDIRELEGMKMNYGPKGGLVKLRWNKGAFDAIGAAITPLGDKHGAPDVPKGQPGFVARPTEVLGNIDAQCDNAVLLAVASLPAEPLNVSSAKSTHFAPKRLKALDPDGLLASYSHTAVEASLNRLRKRGLVETCEVAKDRHRHVVMGLRLASRPDILSAPASAPDIFN